jgi:hypothetical protein
MATFLTLLASSTAEDQGGGIGFALIAGTLVAIVVVIAIVWTLVARRGSRMPERRPQRPDQGVRGH